MDVIRSDSERIKEDLITYRRYLHQNPELSFEEYETADYIRIKLEELEISYESEIAQTGIIATIDGDMEGKTLLIRADIDALPVLEENKLEYKSQNVGVSHVCGHDVHIAGLLGVANVLNQHKDKIRGRILLVFQPGEESPPGGAKAMIESGKLHKDEEIRYDAAISLHVTTRYPVNKIALRSGVLVGSTDALFFTVKGESGHASAPHEAVDSNFAAVEIINKIYGYLSRKVDPMEPVVFTVGRITGGDRYNIIAGECTFDCALRTQNEDLRETLLKDIPKFAKSIGKQLGTEVEVEIQRGYSVGKNSEDLTEIITEVTKEMYGENAVIELKNGHLIGEDFFEFSIDEQIPVAMFWLGGRNEFRNFIFPNHSSRFNVDEDCLPMGVAILAKTAISYLED